MADQNEKEGSNTLSLEKMNYDLINQEIKQRQDSERELRSDIKQLSQDINNLVNSIPQTIQSAISQAVNSNNGKKDYGFIPPSGSKDSGDLIKLGTIIALLVTMLSTWIGNNSKDVDKLVEASSQQLGLVSGIKTEVDNLKTFKKDAEDRFENFKVERQNILNNKGDVEAANAKADAALNDFQVLHRITDRLTEWQNKHDKEVGAINAKQSTQIEYGERINELVRVYERRLDSKNEHTLDKHLDGHPADLRMQHGEGFRISTQNQMDIESLTNRLLDLSGSVQKAMSDVSAKISSLGNPNADPRYAISGSPKYGYTVAPGAVAEGGDLTG